jgi:integral membrane protein (TIGR01906 family)
MRIPRLLAVALFVAAVPIFLITTNVRWVINAPILYSYGFDKYNTTITAWTGIERDEYLSAASQIRDYFNNNEDDLDVRVVQRGVRTSIYNDREISHMRDVKGLVRWVYRVQLLTGAYLAAFIVFGLVSERRRSLPPLGRRLARGGALTIGLVIMVGLGALAGFDRLFYAFHLVSFSNDLWMLDPSQDNLIAMFPEGFFFDATMWIAASTVTEAAALVAVPLFFLRRSKRRDPATVRPSTSSRSGVN